MNHSFLPAIGSDKCMTCKYPELAHTEQAQCDCCPSVGKVHIYATMLMCDTCIAREKEHEAKSEERLTLFQIRENALNRALAEARLIDNGIQVKTDLFNAATTSIVDLKKVIDEDQSITNKPYALASELMKRFTHYKQAVFELNQQVIEAGNQQKAIQVYLNQLANQLRQEEREKLKIADISYKPGAIKPEKPKAIRVSKKIDKTELRKFANQLSVDLGVNIPEYHLQMLVVQKGISVEQAADILRRSINEAKSESTNQ